MRRLATARGLELTWPVDAEPWWEPAHLTWFVAERHGLGQAWVERAGRAPGKGVRDQAADVSWIFAYDVERSLYDEASGENAA
ncbi:hypothetical protein [Streptomyces sp. NPDC001165]|uniref:hypothetical protein n=1 Tax=Streptomyces sp. NPDC001165 TaxID=3364546 RepID=UPI0036961D56